MKEGKKKERERERKEDEIKPKGRMEGEKNKERRDDADSLDSTRLTTVATHLSLPSQLRF